MINKYLIAIFTSLLLVGCGGANSEFMVEVKNKNGGTENLSLKELVDMNESNSAKFKSMYGDADINFTGTVKSVEGPRDAYSSIPYYVVMFEEGIELNVIKGCHDDIILQLDKGTKLKVDSDIQGIYSGTGVLIVSDMHRIGGINQDMSKLQIIK